MSSSKRQRVERVPGSRRAKLTPAPGTAEEPAGPDADTEPSDPKAGGPNDDRMRQDVPPHY